MALAYVVLEPDPGTLYARPLGGGADIALNTRWRDVQIGVTKPDATNTGTLAGVALRTVTQETMEITEPNTLLENLDIHGRLLARAPGLVVRNCRIRGTATPNNIIEATRPGNSATFVDCTIIPDTPQLGTDAFFGGDATFIRCQAAHTVDGWGILPANGDYAAATGVQLLGCYFHDFLYWSPDPAHQGQPGAGDDNATHNDAVQIHGGAGAVIRGCHFDMIESPYSFVGPGGHSSGGEYGAHVTVTPNQAAVTGFLIEQNWFDHGIGVRGIGWPNDLAGTIRNNRFANINPAPWGVAGTLSRPVVFPNSPASAIADFPTATGPDVLAGNVDYSGNPITIWRQDG